MREIGEYGADEEVCLRPGGLSLTRRALSLCSFPAGARVLDLGCGKGTSLDYMGRLCNLDAFGMDISPVFLAAARGRCPGLPFVRADAGSLPFRKNSFDGIICECVFSLVDAARTLGECHRVLNGEGILVVNDVYDRAPGGPAGLARRGEIGDVLSRAGFRLTHFEDASGVLREYAAGLILEHGSLAGKSGVCCAAPFLTGRMLAAGKIGYYMLTARKDRRPAGARGGACGSDRNAHA